MLCVYLCVFCTPDIYCQVSMEIYIKVRIFFYFAIFESHHIAQVNQDETLVEGKTKYSW